MAVWCLVEGLNPEIENHTCGVVVDGDTAGLVGKGDGVRPIEARDKNFEDAVGKIITVARFTANSCDKDVECRE